MLRSVKNHGNQVPRKEWTHRFIHTLDTIPKNWYLELEMHRDTTDWDYITQRFQVTFTFQNESPLISTTLQVIKQKIFTEEESMEVISVCNTHNASMMVHKLLECYNVTQEDQDDEDPYNIQVLEIEGE
jgi:predicted acetyltransferase